MFSRPLQTCRSKSKGSNPQHRFRCSSRVTRPSKMAHRGIGKLLKSYHLRPVKSMKFTFDPYSPNVRSIRLVCMCVSCFFCTTLWDPWPILLELDVIVKGVLGMNEQLLAKLTKQNRSTLGKRTHQTDTTNKQGNNNTLALLTKIVFVGCKKIDNKRRRK